MAFRNHPPPRSAEPARQIAGLPAPAPTIEKDKDEKT
jgi:hypothetical protein